MNIDPLGCERRANGYSIRLRTNFDNAVNRNSKQSGQTVSYWRLIVAPLSAHAAVVAHGSKAVCSICCLRKKELIAFAQRPDRFVY